MSLTRDEKHLLDWIPTQKAEMIHLAESWASLNTGSSNIAGLEQQAKVLEETYRILGGKSELLALPPRTLIDDSGEPLLRPVGPLLSIRKRPKAPIQILLNGHMDTVFGVDHPFQKTSWLDSSHLRGPGIIDLKGGLVILLKTVEALERSSWFTERCGWQIILNPDEEVGSTSSAPFLREAAAGKVGGFVFEPLLPDGAFVNQRYGSANYAIKVRGRAAHVGRHYNEGRSALAAAAKLLLDCEGENSATTIVNAGAIHGGGPNNVVPDFALLRMTARFKTVKSQERFHRKLKAFLDKISKQEGLQANSWEETARGVKPFDAKAKALFGTLKKCGEELKRPIDWRTSGGVSDGNILAEVGLPCVDTLGAAGSGIHTAEETLDVGSLVPQCQLAALLILRWISKTG